MIIESQKSDVVVGGSFKTSSFKIQASAKAFEILSSNIYTHKVRAVIRELSCNAHDAHVAAGNSDPFDVHLPTMFEPWFSIRDYGTGLSDDQVREIFTTYFLSTKTNSNEYIGALGLGSKSPFCIVDSFSVNSYYNGTKSIYTCYKNSDGEPEVALLLSEETELSNGLEIVVNIDSKNREFEEEAVFVYSYFDKLPNINNNNVVEAIKSQKSSLWFSNDRGGFKNGYGSFYAVMGNVAYEIPDSFYRNNHYVKYGSNLSGYLKFEIGDLNFDPGRETLSMDTKTKEKLGLELGKFLGDVRTKIVEDITSCDTLFKRAKKHQEHIRLISNFSIVFNDRCQLPILQSATVLRIRLGSRGRFEKSLHGTIDLSNGFRIILKERGFEKTIKHNLYKDRSNVFFVVSEEDARLLQIDPEFIERISSLEQPPKIKRTGYSKISGVKVYDGSSEYIDNDCVTVNENIYVPVHAGNIESTLSQSEKWYVYKYKNIVDELNNMGRNVKLLLLNNQFRQTKRFKKGNFINLFDYLEREFPETFVKFVDPREEVSDVSANLDRLADFLVDPIFKEYREKLKRKNSKLVFYAKKIDKDESACKMVEEIEARYPMLKLIPSCNLNSGKYDIINYVNGIFQNGVNNV